jgi:CHAT domain-containing protein
MKKSFYRWLILLIFWMLLTIGISPTFSQTLTTDKTITQIDVSAINLVKEAQQLAETGDYSTAIQKLKGAIQYFREQQQWQSLANTYLNLGRLQLALGDTEASIKSWQEAEKIYRDKLKNLNGITISHIYQAQAWQNIGNYPLACQMLIDGLQINSKDCSTLADDISNQQSQTWQKLNNLVLKSSETLATIQITGWRNLGDILRVMGKLKESKSILETLNKSELEQEKSAVLLSLGNTLRSMGNLQRDRQADTKYDYIPWRYDPVTIRVEQQKSIKEKHYSPALDDYENAANLASTSARVTANLNRLSLLLDMEDWSAANKLISLIDIEELPLSQSRIYARINYAKSLAFLQQQSNSTIEWADIFNQISLAVQEAKGLTRRIESYAIGNLGSFYEYRAWWLQNRQQIGQDQLNLCKTAENCREIAYELTQNALYLSQPNDSPYIAYQWQWQLGRLLENQGKREEAIAYYEAAIHTLQSVRSDLLAISSDVQFDFRDNVEPLYRQLVDLLLSQVKTQQISQENAEKAILEKAIENIQSLQLAELEDFLRCTLQKPEKISLNKNEAIIVPVISQTKIDIILKLPNNNLKYYNSPVCDKKSPNCSNQIQELLSNLTENLATPGNEQKVKQQSKILYKWLIKPLEIDLETSQINTLLFILDTHLRNIPMGVLYDGKKYLIEKYAVAVSSGLELKKSQNLERQKFKAILAGLSKPYQGYSGLDNVEKQFAQIKVEINSEILLNDNFNTDNFTTRVARIPSTIIHLATHGQFSSDIEDTFIITSDGRINPNHLSEIIQNREKIISQPLELLTLIACETAKGDNRATLGLAGIAFKAGARTTLAPLWKIIADQSSGDLISHFYRELKNSNNSKAIALQKAQQFFLNDKNHPDRKSPDYWAAYILIGDWL